MRSVRGEGDVGWKRARAEAEVGARRVACVKKIIRIIR